MVVVGWVLGVVGFFGKDWIWGAGSQMFKIFVRAVRCHGAKTGT